VSEYTDLGAFVLARLEEEVTLAQACTYPAREEQKGVPGVRSDRAARPMLDEWAHTGSDVVVAGSGETYLLRGVNDVSTDIEVPDYPVVRSVMPSEGAHIAAQDPRRVLAGASALRAVVDLHGRDLLHECIWSGNQCPTMREIGSIWADHPSYRALEWAPGYTNEES
jgi:hypothetical protein